MRTDIINKRKKELNLTNEELSRLSGVPIGTLSKIMAGFVKNPKLETIKAIANVLNCTLEDFSDDGTKITPINNGLKLSKKEKDIIKAYRNHLEMQDAIDRLLYLDEEPQCYYLPKYDVPVSAGTGQYIDYPVGEMTQLYEEPPQSADYVVTVSGDSMEPTYYDGDMLYINRTNSIEYGQIGLFICCGDVLVKEYGKHGLISHNKKYDVIQPDENMKCVGRVLGVVMDHE